ncbi:inorganic phosphate transporter [Roseibium sediminis]|uniref:inorganic phosphate transporter n=1 Tax=Roseibium sediminis TaxID=1775174 RepID=UPI00123CBE65|nr:inorganic phosphate transporter [Roseibium sediminis]
MDPPRKYKGPVLDKDLDKIAYVEGAADSLGRRLVGPGLALAFIVFCGFVATTQFAAISNPNAIILAAAAAIGAYMALNIGANDVANNVGPAVGAKAISLRTALLIAVVFECAGALLAGDKVLNTVATNIMPITPQMNASLITSAMMAALVSSAVWIHIATYVGAPVSTTHSVIGGIMGAGIAAAGWSAVSWPIMGTIAASWVMSPLLGALVAACLLAFINAVIVDREDKLAAARQWLPILIGIMVCAFTAFFLIKALDRVLLVPVWLAFAVSLILGGIGWFSSRPVIARQTVGLENRSQSLKRLFVWPLVAAASVLSFAHGANDVANAVGPVAAIVEIQRIQAAGLDPVALEFQSAGMPLWVSAIGALGISLGLILFGPRLIRVVGQRITKLNPIRAFCVSLSAAITVLLATSFGLPVSSTYIAVGAIFGVGFYREWRKDRSRTASSHIFGLLAARSRGPNREVLYRRLLVRRSYLLTIIGAWVVTVPIAGCLAAVTFHVIQLLSAL